ncbi:RNA polymerase factor sigma-54 [Caldovatus aquaticus]|uniref:RNA polymerase sigma-54 factor n=1 Tax=Caldovatus aquaticus TaxID=2865671 RepID=A0ABS7F4P0_9PROT|nr:RNA polymerase factor sigma-54 [Caldovatus aquaticus]MBW8270590.1 RNA polymerase factor sigma-54 [Caldovatus aquaticus]
MALGPRLELRQAQSLVMTPQLRQAIKLLQSSNLEVAAFVEEELERNPLLERDERPDLPDPEAGRGLDPLPPAAAEAPPDAHAAALSEALPAEAAAPLDIAEWDNVYEPDAVPARGRGAPETDDDLGGVEAMPAGPRPLHEHLAEQARLAFADPKDRLIATALIALLDPAGRLDADLGALAAALGCEPARIEAVRQRMQRFDPVGLFCRNLRECLAVQLAERNRLDPAMETLLDHLDLLARREHAALMRLCGVDAEDLAGMIAELRRLDPKPGTRFDFAPAPAVVPDLLLRRAPDGAWVVELNPGTMPRLLVKRGFHARAVVAARTREEKAFLADRLASATWLVRSLEQRAATILKVAAEIVRRQDGFLRHGVEHLRPLTLRDVAEAVGLHESTVSRVAANKRIATPRGIFELKYFFTNAIPGTAGGAAHSAEAVRQRIRALIACEKPHEVLSDDAIVERLRQEGVDIARRTVAKYREALGIPSSLQRRKEKAVPA